MSDPMSDTKPGYLEAKEIMERTRFIQAALTEDGDARFVGALRKAPPSPENRKGQHWFAVVVEQDEDGKFTFNIQTVQ